MIRRATDVDTETIAAIYIACRKRDLSFVHTTRPREEIRDWIRDHLIPENDVWVVEEGGLLLAMMALSAASEAGWIEQLYVRPEVSGQGIGSQLLLKAKQELDSPIFLHCFQENERARKFYERHGFRPFKLTDGSENEERSPDVLYRWEQKPNNNADGNAGKPSGDEPTP